MSIKYVLGALMCIYLCSSTYAQQTCTDGSSDDCTSLNAGIAVDKANNQIYYIAYCPSDIAPARMNYTIKRVSTNGGAPTTVYTEGDKAGSFAGNLYKIYAVVNGYLYYDRAQSFYGTVPYIFNLATSIETRIDTPGYFRSQLDIAAGNSYTYNADAQNNLAILRYTGIIGQGSSGGSSIYNFTNTLTALRHGVNNEIIFALSGASTPTTTTVYRGSDAGNADKSLPTAVFSVSDSINSLDVDNSGSIVYGTANGLFIRVGTTTTQLSSEQVISLVVYGQKVFYNTGSTIRSVNLNGSGATVVIQPATGKCTTEVPTTSTPAPSTPAPAPSSSCYGEVISTARQGGSWITDNTFYQIYDITIKNLGRCPITRALYDIVYISTMDGNAGVYQSWNVEIVNKQAAPNTINLFGGVAPGTTYSGAGIIVYNATTSYELFHGPNTFCDAECTSASS